MTVGYDRKRLRHHETVSEAGRIVLPPVQGRERPALQEENGRVTRVEWTRTEPGDIEHVVSMLLCRENPSAVRIRPSRGDGGIDVLTPSRDGTGVAVYQVKSFTRNLTQGQKAQAERSFR